MPSWEPWYRLHKACFFTKSIFIDRTIYIFHQLGMGTRYDHFLPFVKWNSMSKLKCHCPCSWTVFLIWSGYGLKAEPLKSGVYGSLYPKLCSATTSCLSGICELLRKLKSIQKHSQIHICIHIHIILYYWKEHSKFLSTACNQTWLVTKHEWMYFNWPESVLYIYH